MSIKVCPHFFLEPLLVVICQSWIELNFVPHFGEEVVLVHNLIESFTVVSGLLPFLLVQLLIELSIVLIVEVTIEHPNILFVHQLLL